jgi:hypothetical protein
VVEIINKGTSAIIIPVMPCVRELNSPFTETESTRTQMNAGILVDMSFIFCHPFDPEAFITYLVPTVLVVFTS